MTTIKTKGAMVRTKPKTVRTPDTDMSARLP